MLQIALVENGIYITEITLEGWARLRKIALPSTLEVLVIVKQWKDNYGKSLENGEKSRYDQDSRISKNMRY